MSFSRHFYNSWLSILLFSLIILVACGEAAEDRDSSSPETSADDSADIKDGGDDEATAGEDETKPVTFTSPVKKADPTTEGAYTFKFAFAEQPDGTTWSLFWSTTEGATEGGTVVLAEQAMTVTEYIWEMGGLDQGEYFFYIQLNFTNGGTTVHPAPGSIQYSEKGATSNVSPQIKDLGADFSSGEIIVNTTDTVEIPYSVFDADGDIPTITIALSADGGVTYDIILSDNAPIDGFTWDVAESEVGAGVYHLRLTADDGESLADEETSTAPFVVNDGTSYTYDTDIAPIMVTYCNECHGTGESSSNLFQSDTYGAGVNSNDKQAGDMAERIVVRAVDFETMPTPAADNPAPLPNAQQLILKAWFLQGADQN